MDHGGGLRNKLGARPKHVILYIKATVVSVCLSVRAVPGNFFQALSRHSVLCRRGGGPGKLRNFLIWEFRSL